MISFTCNYNLQLGGKVTQCPARKALLAVIESVSLDALATYLSVSDLITKGSPIGVFHAGLGAMVGTCVLHYLLLCCKHFICTASLPEAALSVAGASSNSIVLT